jgi:hypothetical protein
MGDDSLRRRLQLRARRAIRNFRASRFVRFANSAPVLLRPARFQTLLVALLTVVSEQ